MADEATDLIARGDRARREGRLDEAQDAYRQASELLRAPGREATLASALAGLGRIARDRGQRDEALRHYHDALALSRLHGSPLAAAHYARHLGDIHLELGQAAQAEPHVREALETCRGHLDTKVLDLANVLRSMALVETALGRRDAALGFWQEARLLYAAIRIDDGVSECARQVEDLRRIR